MPRGQIRYEVLQEGDSSCRMPWVFGRGVRERVLATLAVAGPMYSYELRASAGNAEVAKFERLLGPLLRSGLVLSSVKKGTRRVISLNDSHPWAKDLRALCLALASVSRPRILLASTHRPPKLRKRVKPGWCTRHPIRQQRTNGRAVGNAQALYGGRDHSEFRRRSQPLLFRRRTAFGRWTCQSIEGYIPI